MKAAARKRRFRLLTGILIGGVALAIVAFLHWQHLKEQTMRSALVNWKTTAAGLAAVFTAIGHMCALLPHGDFSGLAADLPAIVGGVGLIFAKDHNA